MRKQYGNILAIALGWVSVALLLSGSVPTYAEQLAPIYLLLGIVGLALAFLSVCARGRLSPTLHDSTQVDPLTQLANRRALEEALAAGQGELLLMLLNHSILLRDYA